MTPRRIRSPRVRRCFWRLLARRRSRRVGTPAWPLRMGPLKLGDRPDELVRGGAGSPRGGDPGGGDDARGFPVGASDDCPEGRGRRGGGGALGGTGVGVG